MATASATQQMTPSQKLVSMNEQTWLQLGALAELMQEFDRAMNAYEATLRHNPYSIPALTQIASLCRGREQFPKAVEYFQRILNIEQNNGEIWGALGHCYLMMDDLQKAYTAYQQALYHLPNPKEPKLWYGIGILYDRYQSLEHAEEAFSAVLRMDPKFEKANEIYFRLGIIYKQQQKYDLSLQCFQYILRSPPRPLTEVDIWFQIGHVYEQQKEYQLAKEAYERVLTENPNHAKVLQQLGWLCHQPNAPFANQDTAIGYLTKSLEADSADAQSWYLLGRCYMAQQKYSKAYEAYQQAVYRDGKNPTFWCSIGVLYYQIQQYRDALDAYSRAIRLNPYISEVWYDLGTLYESCNNQINDAIDAYQRAAELDPNNPHIKQRLLLLRNAQAGGPPSSSAPVPQDVNLTMYQNSTASAMAGIPPQFGQSLGSASQGPPQSMPGYPLRPPESRPGGPLPPPLSGPNESSMGGRDMPPGPPGFRRTPPPFSHQPREDPQRIPEMASGMRGSYGPDGRSQPYMSPQQPMKPPNNDGFSSGPPPQDYRMPLRPPNAPSPVMRPPSEMHPPHPMQASLRGSPFGDRRNDMEMDPSKVKQEPLNRPGNGMNPYHRNEVHSLPGSVERSPRMHPNESPHNVDMARRSLGPGIPTPSSMPMMMDHKSHMISPSDERNRNSPVTGIKDIRTLTPSPAPTHNDGRHVDVKRASMPPEIRNMKESPSPHPHHARPDGMNNLNKPNSYSPISSRSDKPAMGGIPPRQVDEDYDGAEALVGISEKAASMGRHPDVKDGYNQDHRPGSAPLGGPQNSNGHHQSPRLSGPQPSSN
ncbi:glucose repression mediator protein [Basidiobolus ranarum]|uniref:Glucose repression mediator protein n=1 Tax=Basidiobolus ranarum TaxID=34480 RepID=A0ABR2WT33_9FUNG